MGKSKYSRKNKIHIPTKIPITTSEKVLFTGKYNINAKSNIIINKTIPAIFNVVI